MTDCIYRNDLILMNLEDDGKLIIVNDRMYELIIQLDIDENQVFNDLSDHNLITVQLKSEFIKNSKNYWYEKQYFRLDEESLN